MAPKFPAITASKGNSLSRPHSAIRTPHGRKAASKTPSVVSVDTSPEKPASTTCPPTPSTPSSQSTTILPENASASKPQPKSSYRCTTNVNPHPDQVRGDEGEGGGRGRTLCRNGISTCSGRQSKAH